MKLVYAIKSLNFAHGGAEKVLAEVTAGLVEKGHEVIIITFDPKGGQSFYPLHPQITRIDLGIGDTRRQSGFIDSLRRIISLRRTIKKIKPEAVIAFMHSMFIPVSFALAGSGIPVIASEHIVPEHYHKRRLELMLFALSSCFLTRITVVSQKIKESYPLYLQKLMDVMPNPVLQPEDGASRDYKNNEARNIVLNVGRLDPQKDQETLIRAFAELANDFPLWDLRIIGEGNLRSTLEALVSKLGLEHRIFLPGLSSHISEEYENSALFVMSSHYESFGLATAEAMSYGLPVIGFHDCPGTNEVIRHGINGLLVNDTNRTQGLVNAMRTLMSSERARAQLGLNGYTSNKEFSSEKIVQNWEKLIGHVSAGVANVNGPLTGSSRKA